MIGICLLFAACGGRSENLVPVAGYGTDWMRADGEFLYVVVTDIQLEFPISTLPSGDPYVATANGSKLWLLDQEFLLADGRLFCLRAAEGPPRVTQLDTPLPHPDGDSRDELSEVLTDEDVREYLGT